MNKKRFIVIITFFILFQIVIISTIKAKTPEPEVSMLGYYKFDRNISLGKNNTLFYDFSIGNKNNGTAIFGGTFVKSIEGSSFNLDGINDRVQVEIYQKMFLAGQ